jgi:hypothetical protein
VYEASLDEPIDLTFHDDVVHAEAIRFVRNLDLAARVGEPVGTGAVTVTCAAYNAGLPPGYGR